MIPMAAGPKRILRIHAEGEFRELVQQDKPTLVYVNPSTDPDAFDVWQAHLNDGARWQVGRTRADNSESGQKR